MAKPFNMGSMYWQMNDVWPVVSWSSVDSYGEYKASHYSMKALHANVLVGVKLLPSQTQSHDIHVINDDRFEVSGKL
jgi:beta-mannosidase